MNIFEETRDQVPAIEVARRYGLEIDIHGRAKCPFHADTHPSMTFKDGKWRCWVCGEGGSSIDLTSRLLGLTPLNAVKQLNHDFGLNLPIDIKLTPEEREAARKRGEIAEAHKQFEAWREEMLDKVARCLRIGNFVDRYKWTSEAAEQALTDSEWEAVTRLGDLERYLRALRWGTPEDQVWAWKRREEVEAWIEIILRSC